MEAPRVGDYWNIQGKEGTEVVKVLAIPEGIKDATWHMYNFMCNKTFGATTETEEVRGILFIVLLDRKYLIGAATAIHNRAGRSLFYKAGYDPYSTNSTVAQEFVSLMGANPTLSISQYTSLSNEIAEDIKSIDLAKARRAGTAYSTI